jgi:hypothetical protein
MSDSSNVQAAKTNFIFALSNYSECIKPFLRTAQDRYVGQYYMVEEQPFDFGKYCIHERELVNKAKTQIETYLTQ